MKLLVINGPNLNMLGIREKGIYGQSTYQDLIDLCQQAANKHQIDIEFYQSNHEGDLVDCIQNAYQKVDGIIFNPGAYTHTSIALLDALKAVMIPCIEVHISDVSKREAYRQISYVREACFHSIMGQGLQGYVQAIELFKQKEISHELSVQ